MFKKKSDEFKPLEAIKYMNNYLVSNKCISCGEVSLNELNFYHHENLMKVKNYYDDLQAEAISTMREFKERTEELQVMCNTCLKKKFMPNSK